MFSQASHWYACEVELKPSITARVALTGLLVSYKNLASVTATQGKMFTCLKKVCSKQFISLCMFNMIILIN